MCLKEIEVIYVVFGIDLVEFWVGVVVVDCEYYLWKFGKLIGFFDLCYFVECGIVGN